MTDINKNNLLEQLARCKHDLRAVFDQKLPYNIEKEIQNVNQYYIDLFCKSTSTDSEFSVIKDYDNLIKILGCVKSGTKSKEDACKQIEDCSFDNKIKVGIMNLFAAAEYLFWSTASLFSGLYFIIGVPIIFSDPLIGLGICYFTATIALVGYEKACNSATQFESFDEIKHEETREKNLISFFKTSLPEPIIKNPEMSLISTKCN